MYIQMPTVYLLFKIQKEKQFTFKVISNCI